MVDLRRRGRFRMRNGEIAEVWGKDHDPHPFPWYGKVEGRPDADSWDSTGRNWESPAFDLVERLPSTGEEEEKQQPEPGFYWVPQDGLWEVWHWTGQHWLVPGIHTPFQRPVRLGPRVEPPKVDTEESVVQAADAAYQAGRWDDAVRLFSQAAETESDYQLRGLYRRRVLSALSMSNRRT